MGETARQNPTAVRMYGTAAPPFHFFAVAHAGRAPAGLSDPIQDREQDGHEDRHDRDHDQELDEGESGCGL